MMFISQIKKKVYSFIKKFLNNKLYFSIGKEWDLIIFDDLFPHPVSGFRNAEFIYYLENIPNSKIICTGKSYQILKDNTSIKLHIKEVLENHPSLKGRIFKLSKVNLIRSKFYYCIFFNKAVNTVFPLSNKFKIPFAFTLYPGGGFKVYDTQVNQNLLDLERSPLCKYIITNQKFTNEYLSKLGIGTSNKIFLIPGAPFLTFTYSYEIRKKYFSNKKINIAFAAGKYSKDGNDKGFDIFKKILLHFKFHPNCQFHLVGGFNYEDVGESYENLEVYGYVENKNLSNLFESIDIIVSPNRPFVLCEGCFDGFPLATVVQAGLKGTCILCTDELKENFLFSNGDDLIILNPCDKDFIDCIQKLIDNPDEITRIGNNGRKKLMELFSQEKQLNPRIELLQKAIFNSN